MNYLLLKGVQKELGSMRICLFMFQYQQKQLTVSNMSIKGRREKRRESKDEAERLVPRIMIRRHDVVHAFIGFKDNSKERSRANEVKSMKDKYTRQVFKKRHTRLSGRRLFRSKSSCVEIWIQTFASGLTSGLTWLPNQLQTLPTCTSFLTRIAMFEGCWMMIP